MKELTRILHDLDHGNINKDDAENKILALFKVYRGKIPTFEKNNLPLEVRYAFCEAVEMNQNIQAYEIGITKKEDFINKTIEIKNKYNK